MAKSDKQQPAPEPETPAAPPGPQTPFVRFLSCVEGKLVARYGSGTFYTANGSIGAHRDPTSGELKWNPAEVVALSPAEAARYAREYDHAVRSDSLVERSEADYLAWVKAQKDRQKQVEDEIKAEADKAAAEAKKAESKKG